MSQLTCVVTGANAGIGKETAMQLAKAGAHVVVVCRTEAKAVQSIVEIKQTLGAQYASVFLEPMGADISRPGEVLALAARIKGRTDKLDVLINNAGAFFGARSLTPEGFEKTFATNHLGPLLLTNHLVEHLIKGASSSSSLGASRRPSRIVNVASEAHRKVIGQRSPIDWQSERRYSAFQAYALSKLANVSTTKSMSERLDAAQVVCHCLHPGVVATDIGTKGGGLLGLLWRLGKPFMTSIPDGAKTSVHVALSQEAGASTGQYWLKCAVKRPSRLAEDSHVAEELAELSKVLLRPWSG
jgi:NAD(P)-dependent dehydrogenase (short-subunit alcohol dehydrogenase family)